MTLLCKEPCSSFAALILFSIMLSRCCFQKIFPMRRTPSVLVQAFPSQQQFFRYHESTFLSKLYIPMAIPTDMKSTVSNDNYYDPYEDHAMSAAATFTDFESDEDVASEYNSQLDGYDLTQQLEIPAIYEENESTDNSDYTIPVDVNSPILQGLNPNQLEAVTKPLHSVTRVIAGPGSGKTRVLTNRIAWLLQQNSLDRILAVTFTRKAAGEMQERVHKMLVEQEQFTAQNSPSFISEELTGEVKPVPSDLRRVTLGTFHSVCTKILRWNGDYLASLPSIQADLARSSSPIVLDKDFNIMDPPEQKRIVKQLLDEYEINIVRENVKLEQILRCLSSSKMMIASGKSPFERKKDDPPLSKAMQIVAKIYHRFREKTLESNSLDFDDLLCLSRELLLVHPDVRSSLQRRWRHVFVDEYQDTSQIQVDLIKLLSVDSLFVVGDADQSIYAWRGAHVESLYDFEHVFKDHNRNGVSTVYLMENYRSTSGIIQAAQKVISLSSDVSGADKLRQKMIPQRTGGTAPRIVAFENGEDEANFLVKHIRKNLSSGEYKPSHKVAFVYRTNAQSRLLEEACVQYNVPYVVFGSFTSFYNSHEIKDCLCFLRWLRNGRDRIAMLRAIETPKRGLGDSAIREFDNYCALVEAFWEENCSDIPPPSALDILFLLSGNYSNGVVESPQFPDPGSAFSTRPLKLFIEFSRQMILLREVASYSTVSKTLQFLVDAFDLKRYFNKISQSKNDYEERLANVDELTKAAMRYDADGACLPIQKTETVSTNEVDDNQSSLGLFLDDVSMVTEIADSKVDEPGGERFVASLMTIHASKGMEFDSVFFVGVEDKTIPSAQALEQGEGSIPFEEEKRLCYVAMTRAKTELIMTWRQRATIFTADGLKTVDRVRSRFLDALVSKKTSTSSKKSSVAMRPNTSLSVMDKAKQIKALSKQSPKSLYQTSSVSMRANTSLSVMDKAQQIKALSKQSPKSLYHTSSAYGTEAHMPLPGVGKDMRQSALNQVPRRPQAPKVSQSFSAAAVGKLPLSPRREPNPKSSSKTLDASWFFPIGSKVRHKHLGEGIVLPPIISDSDSCGAVLVAFHTGEQREFPVQTTDLSPVLL